MIGLVTLQIGIVVENSNFWLSIFSKNCNCSYIKLSWPGESKQTFVVFGSNQGKNKISTKIILKNINSRGLLKQGLKAKSMEAVVPIYVDHWGDNLQFYPNFALFSTLGGLKLDHDFFTKAN